MNKVGLLVCGSRTIGGYDPNANFMNSSPYRFYKNFEHIKIFEMWMQKTINNILKIEQIKKSDLLIVEGAAIGPDDLSSIWARIHGYCYLEIPAQWKALGKSAGYIRNSEMINMSRYVLAFYDGQSKGTAHTIKLAKSKKLRTKTVIFD